MFVRSLLLCAALTSCTSTLRCSISPIISYLLRNTAVLRYSYVRFFHLFFDYLFSLLPLFLHLFPILLFLLIILTLFLNILPTYNPTSNLLVISLSFLPLFNLFSPTYDQHTTRFLVPPIIT